ncbi:lysoplasmalogenase [Bacillus cytotoxicus]|uniref:lysoplasmalogenase n=1 Tax=Bacillus cytotoxicus TaxID=580165 RepID=UPI000864119E|nr:lysoplasmalogenase [Bacillus cytotoxicus]AWC27393.1 lysoplasmalogenase [Bacillus cytotoxicus]AWC41233.1 lysoplasmalogenase [Bacillus cytotoxicus]AWC49164.1 lysoplasmalogenase [Bacillus cytotoxicus]AWC51459.1 lysoplasmalogenase [Bacillus cytotoxicus]AWC55588.1 lysoplasmalogenase [Bacillus cytotoxicus]
MNEIYLLLTGQIIFFVIGAIYAIVQTNQVQENRPLPLVVRLVLSFSLTVSAIWMLLQDPSIEYRRWIAIGMTLSTVGDLFMAGLIPFGHRLIGGMITFAIAHCFYVTAFLQAGISWIGFGIGLFVYGFLLVFGWFFFIRNPNQDRLFTLGALIYGVWVGGMACFAFALDDTAHTMWWLPALGGFLFVISDFIIGVTEIGARKIKYDPLFVWLTYVAAQMCIIYAGI